MRIGLNSPQALLALLIRRRWWIIAPFVAATCMVAVLAKGLPKTFVSESLILIQPRDVPADFVVDLIPGTAAERVRFIEQTVMSRTNLVQVVREFGSQMPEFQNLNMDEKVQKLRGQITVKYPMNPLKPTQLANVVTNFRISYSNQNNKLAQEITSKLTLLFIEKDNRNRETRVDGTKDFFKAELEKIEVDLNASEDLLRQMKSAHPFELPERLDANQKTLDMLGQNARNIEDNIGRNVAQRLVYEQLLLETPQTIPSKAMVAATLQSAPTKAPAEDQKILDFRRVRQAYEDVAALSPPQNPDVLRAKSVLDKARARLSAEELEIAEKPPVVPAAPAPVLAGTPAAFDPNPNYQKLLQSYNANETDHEILLKQKADVANRIAIYTRRIENTPQVENELADVLREHAGLQRRHGEIKNKLSITELSASLESQQKGSNFQVLDAANLPVDPSSPRKAVIVLGASAASLFLSVVFAVVVDIARQRIWTQSEIEAFWGVPVLVDIPEILTDTDLAAARRKKWIFAASAAGAAMVYSVCLYGVHLKQSFILRQLDPVVQKLIN